MKKYIAPNLSSVELISTDIITTSAALQAASPIDIVGDSNSVQAFAGVNPTAYSFLE